MPWIIEVLSTIMYVGSFLLLSMCELYQKNLRSSFLTAKGHEGHSFIHSYITFKHSMTKGHGMCRKHPTYNYMSPRPNRLHALNHPLCTSTTQKTIRILNHQSNAHASSHSCQHSPWRPLDGRKPSNLRHP